MNCGSAKRAKLLCRPRHRLQPAGVYNLQPSPNRNWFRSGFGGPFMTFATTVDNDSNSSSGMFTDSGTSRAAAGGQPASTTLPSVAAAQLDHAAATASAETAVDTQRQHCNQQVSRQGKKTLYLIRHGEGYHNIGYEHNLDPHLTPRGWAQTGALQQHLAALQPQLGIELVVVSPLRRTLETAAGVFGAAAAPPSSTSGAGAAAAASTVAAAQRSHQADGDWVLMHPQQAKPLEITRRAMIYLPPASTAAAAVIAAAGNGDDGGGDNAGGADGGVSGGQKLAPLRLLAHEGCRERIGPNVCDKFRDIPLQVADFPGVDFSLLRHDTDVAWQRLGSAGCSDGGVYLVGEEESACEKRALDFYRWIMSRPESRIAVVSHCGFLVHGMRALGKSMLNTWSHAMLQQCSSSSAGSGAMQVYVGAASAPASAGSTGGLAVLAADQAEALRASAGEVGGRMSVDWANCEMRSIHLEWGQELELHSSTAAASSAGNGGADGAAENLLWAVPGNTTVWFPGGLHGL